MDLREHPRYRTKLRVTLLHGSKALEGEILDLGRGGAFVGLADLKDLKAGDHVRLIFVLPAGVEIRASALVRWRRERPPSEGSSGCGLQFEGLGRAETEVLEGFLEECASRRGSVEQTARQERKFVVEKHASGWLAVRMTGFLAKTESQELCERIERELGAWDGGRLLVLIDASEFRPSPEESLAALRTWLVALGNHRLFGGVLVGRSTVGLLQFRRVARDAGIAGSLVCFEEEEDAVAFLKEAQSEGAERPEAGSDV